jgi:hypothetical protein
MMSGMRRINVQDELAEGFELAPAPAMGPDGAVGMPALRVLAPARPRLCEAGPCRNYHRFEIQVEAATPRAQMVPVALPAGTPGAQEVPGGTVYQAPASFHVETHHYCYPTPGVEMALGALPVVACNRWNPYHDAITQDAGALWDNRRAFMASPEGAQYTAAVMAWERARAQELEEAAEAERLIAQSLQPTEGSPR